MPTKKENDYVTKKELDTALNKMGTKIIEEIGEVMRDGFSMTASKKDLSALEAKVDAGFKEMDEGFENLGEKIEKLQFETSSHEDRITKLERKSHAHA